MCQAYGTVAETLDNRQTLHVFHFLFTVSPAAQHKSKEGTKQQAAKSPSDGNISCRGKGAEHFRDSSGSDE